MRFRHGDTICTVRYSPDGKTIASIGYDAVFVWNARNGKPLRRWAGKPSMYRGDFSPDGRRLWLQTDKGEVFVWDLEANPDKGPRPALRAKDNIGVLEVSPDGKLVAVGCEDGLRLWDAKQEQETLVIKDEDLAGREVQFSHDGKRLLTLARGGAVAMWDTASGKIVQRFVHEGAKENIEEFDRTEYIGAFALSPDGATLVGVLGVRHESKALVFWDTATGKEQKRIALKVSRIRFSPDGKRLAVDVGRAFQILNVATGQQLCKTPTVYGTIVSHFVWSPDGRTLAAACGQSVRQWETTAGRELCPIPEHKDGVGYAQLLSDGRTIVTIGQAFGGIPGSGGPGPNAPGLRYWDAATGCQFIGQEQLFPTPADLSADGAIAACAGKKTRLRSGIRGPVSRSASSPTSRLRPTATCPRTANTFS